MVIEIALKATLCKIISNITNNNNATINKNACKNGVKSIVPFVSTIHIDTLKYLLLFRIGENRLYGISCFLCSSLSCY